MRVMRQRFGKQDEVTIRGVRYHWLRRSGDGHLFERLESPFIVEAFSDEQLAEEVRRPDYARRRDHLNPAKVKVRAASGLRGMRDLPEDERATVVVRHDLVRRFLALSAEGRVTRTEEGAGRAIDIIRQDLAAPPDADEAGAERVTKPRIDAVLARAERERLAREHLVRLRGELPCARTLLDWVRRYERGAEAPASLRDGRHASGNTRARHDAEVRRHVSECADEFLSGLRPSMVLCHQELRVRLLHLNEARAADGLMKVVCPSEKYLAKEIRSRRAVQVHAARHGAAEAQARFAPLGEGLDVTYVGQRVEMDEWNVDAHVILKAGGVWPTMTQDWRKTALKTRLWACTAIDAASRVPLGISLSRKGGTVENALTCLAMVVTDKTELSRWAGAETPWSMASVPDEVVTDGGSGFKAAEFQSACVDLVIQPTITVAAKPSMRGRQERMFRTIKEQLCGHIPGRTFSNPVEKGDYDSEERAVVFEEMMLKLMIVYLVDFYCCRPHRGLEQRTPIDVYERLADDYHVNGDPGPHVRREALGVEMQCDLDRHGVRKFNLNWTSDELQDHFRRRGSHCVRVRFDPADLGWVSVDVDGRWVTCGCRREGLQGMPLVAWQAFQADRARRAKAKAREREPVTLRALEKIKAMVNGELARFGLGNGRPTAEDLDLIERRMLHGFVSPERRDACADGPTLADAFDTAWPTGGAPLATSADGTAEDHGRLEDDGGSENEDAVAGETGVPTRARAAGKGTRGKRKGAPKPDGVGAAGKSSKDSGRTDDGHQQEDAVWYDGQDEGDDDFTFERR